MDKAVYRYGTFATFPQDAKLYPSHLAEAGFYYEGNGDEVVCFSCGLKQKGWNKGDIPMQVHKSRSPQCPFLNGSRNSNIAISVTPPKNTASHRYPSAECHSSGSDKCTDTSICTTTRTTGQVSSACGGPSDVAITTHRNKTNNIISQTTVGEAVLSNGHENIRTSSGESTNVLKEQSKQMQASNRRNETLRSSNESGGDITQSEMKKPNVHKGDTVSLTLEPLGISFERPVYPQYAITTVRLSSFRRWPKQLTQKPQDLSKAGFFHEGVADRVRCFFCGGGLVNWDPGDEPWTEHARWYPRCVYLRQSQGDDFVYKVQRGLESDSKSQIDIDPLLSPASISVLEMGCNPDVVRKAWDCLEKANGQENITAEKLLVKVWQLEEEETKDINSSIDIGPVPEAAYDVSPVLEAACDVSSVTAAAYENNSNSVGTEKEDENNSIAASEEMTKNVSEAEKIAIAEENRQLKDQQTCKICLDEDVAIVFLPCGHLAACASCAPALRKCPICRTFIKGTVRAIIS